jgi:amino acid transporter
MQALVIVSILSALLTLMIGSSRQYSALSETNYIKDKNGKLLRRNGQLVPQYAAYN